MTKQPDTNPRTLADGVMLSTLQRAAAGKLRRGEAAQCREMMQAFEAWSNGSQRCELVERAQEIAALGLEIRAQGENLPQDVLTRTKAAIRGAVAQAVTEAMTAEFPKTNGKNHRATPRRKVPAAK